jgi:DNA-binding NtrC family response regulator/tetratricopeptide (TPR) repeat protein
MSLSASIRLGTAVAPGGRGHLACAQALAALEAGRHGEALGALRRARRSRVGAEAPLLALAECEALFGLLRYREALDVASRALERRPSDPDLELRLRVQRGYALWVTGRVDAGRAEVERAARRVVQPLTEARVQETLALMAWRAQQMASAGRHLETARRIYSSCESGSGLVRVLEREGAMLSDAGYIEEALRLVERRMELLADGRREDALGLAHADRGTLLTIVGRWEEARRDLGAASKLLEQVGDPRASTVVEVSRASLELVRGDLAAARDCVLRARAVQTPEVGDPRSLAEALLLSAEIELASGDPAAAERAASEAVERFIFLKDDAGVCRARVRRTHSLVDQARVNEAVKEGRRAVEAAAGDGLLAIAHLAHGRALLHARRDEAVSVLDRVIALSSERPELAHAAAVGKGIARGADHDDPEIRSALSMLEAWADRRLHACCLGDLRTLVGGRPSPTASRVMEAPSAAARDGVVVLAEAALSLAREAEWESRWLAAMRALRPALPWWRAALVGEPGWECRHDATSASLLGADDLARDLVGRTTTAAVYDLLADDGLRHHRSRALHALGAAIVAPMDGGAGLYLDFREGVPLPGPKELSLVAHLARLVAAHLPPPSEPEPEPATFPGIIGRCDAMRALYRAMAAVAPSDVTIHIYGETGTGKEKVAHALHARSRRARGPFVAINAAAYTDDMFQAELFGHRKGAFTGAHEDRDGLVAAAEGGTLFIDEVTELSALAQPRLLRLLQEREYRRMGENHERRANVRVLTASNARLEDRVANRTFRADLMYRLAVEVLDLPPLRERGEDLVLLARHFLAQAATREGRPVPLLSGEATRLLATHQWPGNVRELDNVMQRSLLRAGRGPVRAEHLTIELKGPAPRPRSSLREAVQAFERSYISASLARNGGNRARTALELGLTRQGLVAKIPRLGL